MTIPSSDESEPNPGSADVPVWRCLLCAFVILSGCSVGYQPAVETTSPGASTPMGNGGTSEDGSTPAVQPDPTPLSELSPGFDTMTVYRRTEALLGADVPPPARVVVVDPDSRPTPDEQPPFYRALGLGTPAAPPTDIGGRVSPEGTVYLYVETDRIDRPRVEQVLVHEFVHYIQTERGASATLDIDGTNPDASTTQEAVFEGIPVYITAKYTERHLPNGTAPLDRSWRVHRNADGVYRYYTAPYPYGARYVAWRMNSTGNLSELYRTPPRTTEEVIHRLPPGTEPVSRLDTETALRDWTHTGTRGPYGELFLRAALGTELSEGRAARAADGWGNDVLLRFRSEGGRGYAWVIRWDDARNASEFDRSFTTFLRRHATRDTEVWRRDDTTYRLLQPDRRTTVVLLGSRQFVEAVRATSGDGTVSLGSK